MRKEIIITILLFAVVFGGCYMYADNHMSEDEINNVMRYIPFKEKKTIKRDSSKKHTINKDKKEEEAKRSDADNKNIPKEVKKKSHAKETITVKSYKCQYCGDTIYYIIEDKEYGINGDICWDCYWNKVMEIIYEQTEEKQNDSNKTEDSDDIEEPVYDEYGYDQYGNYDPNKDLHNDREWSEEDYNRWEEIYGDDLEDYEEDNYYDNTTEELEEYDTEEYNEDDTTDDDNEDITE